MYLERPPGLPLFSHPLAMVKPWSNKAFQVRKYTLSACFALHWRTWDFELANIYQEEISDNKPHSGGGGWFILLTEVRDMSMHQFMVKPTCFFISLSVFFFCLQQAHNKLSYATHTIICIIAVIICRLSCGAINLKEWRGIHLDGCCYSYFCNTPLRLQILKVYFLLAIWNSLPRSSTFLWPWTSWLIVTQWRTPDYTSYQT